MKTPKTPIFGTYRISFWHGSERYQREVEIQPGKLTFVNFQVKKQAVARFIPDVEGSAPG